MEKGASACGHRSFFACWLWDDWVSRLLAGGDALFQFAADGLREVCVREALCRICIVDAVAGLVRDTKRDLREEVGLEFQRQTLAAPLAEDVVLLPFVF